MNGTSHYCEAGALGCYCEMCFQWCLHADDGYTRGFVRALLLFEDDNDEVRTFVCTGVHITSYSRTNKTQRTITTTQLTQPSSHCASGPEMMCSRGREGKQVFRNGVRALRSCVCNR